LRTLTGAYSAHARDLEEGLAASIGIELRRPLFTPAIVQFAFAMPESLKLRGRTDKYLHRQAMEGFLPPSVRDRHSKADFMVTFRWHLGRTGDISVQDLNRASGAWVAAEGLAQLHARLGDPAHSGAPEWTLWTLFGCDALAARP
jgi:asparagine synthase (glutamine-hydrolysing)